MKNHYDKIFLALAFLLVVASAGYFFVGSSSLESFKAKNKSLQVAQAQGEDWELREVKTNLSKSMAWRLPEAQDDNGDWFFQVFTPPRIWVDAQGNFLTQAPTVEVVVVEEKFDARSDLYLSEVTSGKYPVSLLGYVGSVFQFKDDRDASNPVEFNGKVGEDLSYKDPRDMLGKTMIDLGLKFLSFKKERVTYADNTMEDVMIVELEDKKLGKTIVLRTDKDTILEDQRKLILTSTIDKSKTFPITKVGEEIDYNNSKYKVEELSFDDKFIVLAQRSKDPKVLPAKHRLTVKEKISFDAKEDSNEASSAQEL